MAKPTYSIGGLDYATLQKIEAFLNGVTAPAAPQPQPQPGQAPVPPAPPAPPVAPAAPVAPPAPPIPAAAPVAPPAPPLPTPAAPVAPPDPPAPPAGVPIAATAPAPAGGPTMQDVIKAMADAVQRCGAGGAGKVGPLMAQYNAQNPGVAGPVSNVDPAQYGNLKAALDALLP